MQNDGLYDDMKDGHGYCAGFMAARATPNMRDAFTVSEEDLTPGWDDQRHLNLIKDRLHVKALPLHLFPNGQYYQRHRERLSKARGMRRRISCTGIGMWGARGSARRCERMGGGMRGLEKRVFHRF